MFKNTADVLFRYLPLRISRAVHALPADIFTSINEIRLRKNSPVSVTCGDKNIMFDENGNICPIHSAIRAADSEINECISKLTDGSLYTCDEYLAQGFIPLAEGGRAGVCGRANIQNGKMIGFAEIYSVNLRLHRFLPNVAIPLINTFAESGIMGTLVCSPPALGKTTFLRSAAYLLASGQGIKPLRVGIADERGELSAGLPKSGITDLIYGAPKADAISLLTRNMAPEVIVCDEIGAHECDAVLESQNTGVNLIASAHCLTPKELKKRGRLKLLLESGIFPLCVILSYENGYKCTVTKTEEYL